MFSEQRARKEHVGYRVSLVRDLAGLERFREKPSVVVSRVVMARDEPDVSGEGLSREFGVLC